MVDSKITTFSCIKFQKYFYVIFNEQTGLYYANKQ